MGYTQEQQNITREQVIENLGKMRQYEGHPKTFWPSLLENTAHFVEAKLGLILIQDDVDAPWKTLCHWPPREREFLKAPELIKKIEAVADASLVKKYAWDNSSLVSNKGEQASLLAIRFELLEESWESVAVFVLDNRSEQELEGLAINLKLIADTPVIYQLGRMARQSMDDVNQFSEALDLMLLLNAEERYLAAAMTFCNEISSRYLCSRVSLGWLEDGYVRLQAISHMERFEKKMEVVQALETVMEEAFDQDEEILWPQPDDSTAVTRDHAIYTKEQSVSYMVSLPLRLENSAVAVLCCERAGETFSDADLRGLRVLCDQAVRRLGDLKEHDRWFGAQIAADLRKRIPQLKSAEHTFAKGIGLLLCLLLAFLLFGRLPYRVEAPFILRTDDVKYLPAAHDGYIDSVPVRVGDRVDEGALLLTLDTRELLLEESAAIANLNRYSREAEKGRAENALAEMKISMALAAQARAQLDLIRYKLNHSEVKAPFQGIVVEGDLEELLGAPVNKGDVLFKVAHLEKMYAEFEISERDIHELSDGLSGEIAFVSQPQLKFRVTLERVDPVSQAKEEGNIFLARGMFPEQKADWWRPGMSGVAKIDVGSRNVLWILTHRTIDFFRMLLWW
ncbi:MAG: efflux RND transporter periplasmic adaptor subunit [Desulfuromonas sp.]|nr:efflux RND transporter periplasmic adaptor subunit [Desulfuromonas sp.]